MISPALPAATLIVMGTALIWRRCSVCDPARIRFGSASYGPPPGRMTLVRQFLAAMAPFAFAFMIDQFGTTAALLLLVAFAVLGLAAFLELARIRCRLTFVPVPAPLVANER